MATMNVQQHQRQPIRRSVQSSRPSAQPLRAPQGYGHDSQVQGSFSSPVTRALQPPPPNAPGHPSAPKPYHPLDPEYFIPMMDQMRAAAKYQEENPDAWLIGLSRPYHVLPTYPHDADSELSHWEFTAPSQQKSNRKSTKGRDEGPTEAQRVAMEYLRAQSRSYRASKPLPPVKQLSAHPGHKNTTTTTSDRRHRSFSSVIAQPQPPAQTYAFPTYHRNRSNSVSAAARPMPTGSSASKPHRTRRSSTTATGRPTKEVSGVAPNGQPSPYATGPLPLPRGFQPAVQGYSPSHPINPSGVKKSRSRRSSNAAAGHPAAPNSQAVDDRRGRRASKALPPTPLEYEQVSRSGSQARSRRQTLTNATNAMAAAGRTPSSHSRRQKESTPSQRSSSKSNQKADQGASRERKNSRISRYGPFSISAEALAVSPS